MSRDPEPRAADMSKRDHIALTIMASIIAGRQNSFNKWMDSADETTETAFKFADAFIAKSEGRT